MPALRLALSGLEQACMCAQLVPLAAAGPLPFATGDIEFMILSGAEFPVERVREIFDVGQRIRVPPQRPLLCSGLCAAVSAHDRVSAPDLAQDICAWDEAQGQRNET